MNEIDETSRDRTPYPTLGFRQRQQLKAVARSRGITEEEARKQVMDAALHEAASAVLYTLPAPLQ